MIIDHKWRRHLSMQSVLRIELVTFDIQTRHIKERLRIAMLISLKWILINFYPAWNHQKTCFLMFPVEIKVHQLALIPQTSEVSMLFYRTIPYPYCRKIVALLLTEQFFIWPNIEMHLCIYSKLIKKHSRCHFGN